MVMPMLDASWTVERINALPDDGNRYEVIDGERFVTPAPSNLHQAASLDLAMLMYEYVRRVGQSLFVAPTAVTFSTRREVQPDLLVMPKREGRRATVFADVGRLTLAVEVLSPHTSRVDRTIKRALFQEERVPEYWIVDPIARTVDRWRVDAASAERLTETLAWQPDARIEPLTIDLVAYFRRVHDEE
jgi:Uma2 family endonuclease